jgi:hypothetical protein
MPDKPNNKPFEVKAALVCEDVRREISGKEILIGVFADAVFITQIPVQLILTLYLRAMIPDQEELAVQFRVIGPGDVPVTSTISANLQKPLDPTTSVSVVVTGIAFQVQSFGQYRFQWKPPGQEWETVAGLELRKGEAPPAGIMPIMASIVS